MFPVLSSSRNHAVASLLIPCLILLSLARTVHSFQPSKLLRHTIALDTPHPHFLAKTSDDTETTKQKRAKGVYVRPSAVIEKGSGFFFPGLEGPRVRLFTGTALLAVTAINHVLTENSSGFSEALAVFYSFLVLFQGVIESVKDGRVETIASRDESSVPTQQQLSQQWSSTATEGQDKVEWAAASFLALTPATHMMLLRRDNDNDPFIYYSLGPDKPSTNSEKIASAAMAALDTAKASQGGRVALPVDHPAAVGLIDNPQNRRCVILQQVSSTPDMCWMVASNDLLASFTKGDLQWLGQMATFVLD
ncbi:expressed unknown protein [Seminavis robusta]|uniref:Uncharacterized protein n=1 Tax=Seminavis robusta TaxID=568900 RepID=A0A9N8DYM4_9STRA|nr:expressed unknown protein [Seminavis robusta]|eukprot:Sro473_g150130.1 n/a (306) ;mRNA; f:39914-40831